MTLTNEQRDKKIQETHTRVTQLLERWQVVDDLKETVYGNGHKGLKTRVDLLEARLKDSRKSASQWATWASSIIVGVIIGLVVAFFGK